MSHPVALAGSFVPLDMLDELGASPLDDRDMRYWGCDPFEVVALIEEEMGVPLALLIVMENNMT